VITCPVPPTLCHSPPCDSVKEHDSRANTYLPSGLKAGILIYRVIRKSLRDLRPLQYSSRDGHAEGQLVNRGVSILPYRCSICPFCCVLGVAQPSSEVQERLTNYPVYTVYSVCNVANTNMARCESLTKLTNTLSQNLYVVRTFVHVQSNIPKRKAAVVHAMKA
jgi:hypothetical protein